MSIAFLGITHKLLLKYVLTSSRLILTSYYNESMCNLCSQETSQFPWITNNKDLNKRKQEIYQKVLII